MAAGEFLPRTFMASLAADDREALLTLGHRRRWEPQDALASGGSDVVLGFSAAGDLLGEIVALREATRSATLTALEPVDGLVIPVDSFRSFLRDHPRAMLS